MKLKFKHQAYQAEAVQAVVDCFKGQLPNDAARHYKIDPGAVAAGRSGSTTYVEAGFKNAEIQLSEPQLLANIQAVQARQNLPQSCSLNDYRDRDGKKLTKYHPGAKLNLDIEMETGTGHVQDL